MSFFRLFVCVFSTLFVTIIVYFLRSFASVWRYALISFRSIMSYFLWNLFFSSVFSLFSLSCFFYLVLTHRSLCFTWCFYLGGTSFLVARFKVVRFFLFLPDNNFIRCLHVPASLIVCTARLDVVTDKFVYAVRFWFVFGDTRTIM